MQIVINVLSLLIAAEFFYIMYLESFATQSETTGRVFNMTPAELANPQVQVLFKNQGVYNGLLAVGIFYAMLVQPELLLPILIYIILVALYGSFSSGDKTIVIKQAGLAIITVVLILLK